MCACVHVHVLVLVLLFVLLFVLVIHRHTIIYLKWNGHLLKIVKINDLLLFMFVFVI